MNQVQSREETARRLSRFSGVNYRTLPGRHLVFDDTPIDLPEGWYSTAAFTDHALDFIEEGARTGKPFFLYLAYTAPHWPAGIPAKWNGTFTPEVGHVIDLLPTFLELAQGRYGDANPGRKLTAMAGTSLVPALRGGALGERALFFEHQGNAAIRVGRWKLVRAHGKRWELYDLHADRTELADLAAEQPGRVASLKSQWESWANRVGVQSWPIRN